MDFSVKEFNANQNAFRIYDLNQNDRWEQFGSDDIPRTSDDEDYELLIPVTPKNFYVVDERKFLIYDLLDLYYPSRRGLALFDDSRSTLRINIKPEVKESVANSGWEINQDGFLTSSTLGIYYKLYGEISFEAIIIDTDSGHQFLRFLRKQDIKDRNYFHSDHYRCRISRKGYSEFYLNLNSGLISQGGECPCCT